MFTNRYGRELPKTLEYIQWRKFESVIEKAINACNYVVSNHFVGADKMIDIGSNTLRNIVDYKLSKYVCHLMF